MKTTTHGTLWHITQGERLRYGYAILAMAATNVCMFGAPLVAKYAIDVVVEQDFSYAAPPLLWLTRASDAADPSLAYLWLSAGAAAIFLRSRSKSGFSHSRRVE